jgi:hypothetical protein
MGRGSGVRGNDDAVVAESITCTLPSPPGGTWIASLGAKFGPTAASRVRRALGRH